MRRRRLVELEDLKWWPRAIRDGVTDYLATASRLGKVYQPIVPRLAAALGKSNTAEVLDLCSGGSGPWPSILSELPGVSVRLSDLYPNRSAFEVAATHGFAAEFEPVDATAVPSHLMGFRTLFSAFHHFPPEVARSVLADAVRSGRGIGVFEATARTPAAVALMTLTPLMACLTTPLVRPFRWSRLFWTYLVPGIPFTVGFDGVVSCLRTYTPDEMKALAAEADPEGRFEWEAGREGKGPIPVTYLTGVPKG